MVIFMKKIDSTVVHETKFIALAVIFFSAVTELVFLIIGKWDYTVLLGNLLSGCAAVLNFLLMGITVQNALSKDEKSAKTAVRLSQNLRLLMLFVAAALGVLLPCFNIVTALLPLFFPRIAVMIRPLFKKF